MIVLFTAVGLVCCDRDGSLLDAGVDPYGAPQSASCKTELAPLCNTKCNVTGCYASVAHKPYMATDISYPQITNGGFVNTLLPKQSILYQKINGEMKEYIPSATDRQKVYDWIRNGTPNN